jgi:nucleotide-binding universal stress UspA family protein
MVAEPTLLCYDGSAAARQAIRAAAELFHGGPAIVLTVWEPFEPSLLRPVSDTLAAVSGVAKEIDDIAAEVASEAAREGARLAAEAGFDPTLLVWPGRPRQVILKVAHDTGARAIVLGSRGAGAAESVLFGSVASAVLHHCRGVPVLIVCEPRA